MSLKKPKLRPADLRWLRAAWEAFSRNKLYRSCPDYCAAEVVSDVWDGWATRGEIKNLVRNGIVTELRYSKGEASSVSPVTWTLTAYGLALFRQWMVPAPPPAGAGK